MGEKKNRKMCVFLYGYFQGVRAAESGVFICYHNSLDGSSLLVENVQFQGNVEHTSFPPLWAGCCLKWWRCVCGKTVKVFWRWKHPPMSMWVISHVWQTAGISSCSSESYANPLMWLLMYTHTQLLRYTGVLEFCFVAMHSGKFIPLELDVHYYNMFCIEVNMEVALTTQNIQNILYFRGALFFGCSWDCIFSAKDTWCCLRLLRDFSHRMHFCIPLYCFSIFLFFFYT